MAAIQMAGRTFGRWQVLDAVGRDSCRAVTWRCRCACGAERVLAGKLLRRAESRSCGCLKQEAAVARATRHGHSARGTKTPEYHAWGDMLRRCYRPDAPNYKNYGARGIRVCEQWRGSFAAFLADVGPRPTPKHTLDRIDNAGSYEPGNCRWATRAEQARNRRNNRLVTIGGRTLCLADWAAEVGAPVRTLASRLRAGWPDHEAVLAPVKARISRGAL